MSDIDMPTPRTADAHREVVARVMADVSARMADGEDANAALREVLAADGRSLTDLPEVGMWLAMSAHFGDGASPPTPEVEPAADPRISFDDDGGIEIDLRELPLAEPGPTAPEERSAEPPIAPAAPPAPSASPAPPAAAAPPAPARPAAGAGGDAASRRRRANALRAFLRATLDDRRTRDALRLGLRGRAASGPAPQPTAAPTPTPAPAVAPAPAPAPAQPEPAPEPAPDARVETPPEWATAAEEIDAFLRASVGAAPLVVDLGDPARRGTAVPDPSEPSLRTRRILTRATALEATLAARFAASTLAGEVDLDDLRADVAATWAELTSENTVDGAALVDTAAATLLARALLADATGDESAPDRDAVAAAIAALGLDELASSGALRRHDAFDVHTALRSAAAPIVAAVGAARSSGATSAAETARTWGLARNVVRDLVGEVAFDLLVDTPAGRVALEEIVTTLDTAWTTTDDASGWVAVDRARGAVVGNSTRRAIVAAATRERPPGPAGRPEVLLPAKGTPEVVLPPGGERWHLNGELLAYGGTHEAKVVALDPARNGRWAITARAAGGRSLSDAIVRSWTRADTVLVFDELGRAVPPRLPVAGARATVLAPTGAEVVVDGRGVAATAVVDRRPLGGRWDGFDRFDVSPLDAGAVVTVTTPSRTRVEVLVERRRAARITARPLDSVEGAHHRPATSAPELRVVLDSADTPPSDVTVSVRAGRTARRAALARWGDPAVDGGHLVDLSSFAGHTVDVTVERRGHEAARARVVVPPGVGVATPTGVRLQLDAGWSAAPAVVAVDERSAWRPVELRGGEHPLRLRARWSVEALDPADRRWATDPVAAARATRWSTPEDAERWHRWTGWAPPAGPTTEEGLDALGRLLTPLLAALDGLPATAAVLPAAPRPPFAALTPDQWARAIATDHAAVAAWSRRVGRGVRQWRTRDDASRNLAPLWDRSNGARPGTSTVSTVSTASTASTVVDVVAAAVLAAGFGLRRAAARRVLDDLAADAATLVRSATIFGVAYAEIQRTHPPTRFRAVPIDGSAAPATRWPARRT